MEAGARTEERRTHMLGDLFTNPFRFFLDLRFQPKWGWIFLLYIASLCWMAYGMLPFALKLTVKDVPEITKGMDSVLQTVTVATSVFTGLFSLIGAALFLFIILKLSGFDTTYRQSFSLYVWSRIPIMLYGFCIGTFLVLQGDRVPQPIIFVILSSIFSLWSAFLLWTGIRAMTGMKRIGLIIIGIGLLLLCSYQSINGYIQMTKLFI